MKRTMNDIRPAPHVMLDIETLGTAPGSVILSVAAVPFGGGPSKCESFYQLVNVRNAVAEGFTLDQGTVDWWCARPAHQREWVAGCRNGLPLWLVLLKLTAWWRARAPDACAWACGTDFDIAHLDHAYRRYGFETPWPYYKARDLRTLRAAAGNAGRQPWMQAPSHNALADALAQAAEAGRLLHALDQLQREHTRSDRSD